MTMNVAVVGAGSWGTTVAHICSHNAPTLLYSRRDDVAESINSTRENSRYLSGYALHPDLRASNDLAEVLIDADVVVMGVPSHGFRAMLRDAVGHVPAGVPVISLAKGLERGTNLRMTQIIDEELPGHPVGVLTGPNLAKEILAGQAAAAVIALVDAEVAARLQAVFSTDLFRVYTNTDVIGCELAGALKNIIALASGMADGLGAGDNTRAAVMTRGLAELTRLVRRPMRSRALPRKGRRRIEPCVGPGSGWGTTPPACPRRRRSNPTPWPGPLDPVPSTTGRD